MKHIFPSPKSISFSGEFVRIGGISHADFQIVSGGEGELISSAVEYISSAFLKKCAILKASSEGYKIIVKEDPDAADLASHGPEAYSISISEKEALLVGASDKGAFYAAVTLEKLIEQKGEGIYLPIGKIVDYPKFTKRGVLVESRYNDFMSLSDWKRAVDTFASLKLNKLEISLYGCWGKQYDNRETQYQYVPFKALPEFRAPKMRKYYSVKRSEWVNIPDSLPEIYEKDFLGEIIKYARKKNVEVIPLFNSLGHNNLLPKVITEISAKDENGNPTGTGFCTSSEKTYETLFSLYDEIIDRYLEPNSIASFAVGLDEVTDSAFCKCERCRSLDKKDIFFDHAVRLLRYLKSRGMKEIYVYFDMFFYIFDNLNEELAERFKAAGVYDVLVMDWWNYGASVDLFRGKGDKFNSCFEKSIIRPMSGYWHWQGYSDNTLNIAECAALAEKHNFDGMISYSTFEPALDYQYTYLSEAAWAPIKDKEKDIFDFSEKYFENNYSDYSAEANEAWQNIRYRLHPYNYTEKPPANSEFAQYTYSFVKAGLDYPRNHIAEIIAKIDAAPERYLPYLRELNERARKSLEFFAGEKAEPSLVNENLITTVSEPLAYSEEALTLYRIYKESAEGKLSNQEMISEVKRLIRLRRAHMLRVENSRLESNMHQTLRMMTINLEYLTELLSVIELAESEGRVYVFDPESAINRKAPVFEFLR